MFDKTLKIFLTYSNCEHSAANLEHVSANQIAD